MNPQPATRTPVRPAGRSSPAKRLEARVDADLHRAVKRAAEIQGRTVTDFVVDALQRAAAQAIGQAEELRLTVADQEAFALALIAPPPPNAALNRAFERAQRLLGS